MKSSTSNDLKDGQHCEVVGGTHAGKSGIVKDINVSKTGHTTITVVQANGERFKTLAKNIVVKSKGNAQPNRRLEVTSLEVKSRPARVIEPGSRQVQSARKRDA